MCVLATYLQVLVSTSSRLHWPGSVLCEFLDFVEDPFHSLDVFCFVRAMADCSLDKALDQRFLRT